MIKLTAKTDKARAKLLAVQAALTVEQRDRIVEKAAFQTLTAAVKMTRDVIGVRPDGSRWNIQKPENHWQVRKPRLGTRIIANPDKVMKWLDEGTKPHGPTVKDWLYIPLKRSAAIWHPGLKRGIDYILTKKVKGMKRTNVVEKIRSEAKKLLLAAFKAHIKATIK